MDLIKKLIEEFGLKSWQVQNTVNLIDGGNTIPFIARYRKEATGELDDQLLREFNDRYGCLRNLESRMEEVKKSIDAQGNLTDDVASAIDNARTLQEIEDIYRPFKPKRRTRAMIAREKGLEPLASFIMRQEHADRDACTLASDFVDPQKGVDTVDDAIHGAMDIISEDISDDPGCRKIARSLAFRFGIVRTEAKKKDEDSVYRMYYGYSEPVSRIAGHRVLALNRGEKEEYLKVSVDMPEAEILFRLDEKLVKKPPTVNSRYVSDAIKDSYTRLLAPSVENEIRGELTDNAREQALKVFARNLSNLLLQRPLKEMAVLGLDPGYRTGCKLAVVDGVGNLLDTGVIYPNPPQSKFEESGFIVRNMITRHSVCVVAIGNGTASREAEQFIAGVLEEFGGSVRYAIVNEAGASVYSASKLAAGEFPDYDVSLRSAVSIARRLQDPLAELVKIDPKSIGVGQYQHDMNQKRLDETLAGVVEDCVNSVGVDVNTASLPLLSYVSGINSAVAKNIIEYRKSKGKFRSREDLHYVDRLGDRIFEQCAGFLRISSGENILDNTGVHPESYPAALKLLKLMGYSLDDVREMKIAGLESRMSQFGLKNLTAQIGVGEPTLSDIAAELLKPGRDPRDELPQPVLRSDILELDDLRKGMVLTGTVRNVADFGAFVDIGVHRDGFVHKSEFSAPGISAGDIVRVRVIDVDTGRKRISLGMKGLD